MNRFPLRLYLFLIGASALLALSLWVWLPSGSATARRPAASQVGQAAAPVTDLVVDAIEVTQSMQDLNNSVPLVDGKRTFVRVYVHSTDGTYPTTAILKVDAGVLEQWVLPIAPGGPLINVRPTYNRLIPSHAFLFEVPLWATYADVLSLTVEVNPDLRWRARNPEESSYANNLLTTVIGFDPVPQFNLVIADQPYTFGGITYSARPYDRWKSAEWLSRVYPLSQVKVFYRSLPAVQASRKAGESPNSWDITFPYCSWLNLYLAVNRYAIFGNPFIPKNSVFLGIVTDDIGFMRGCAPIGGMLTANGYSRVASSPVGAGDWGWDFDGSYADWYSAHEVAHALSRPHVRGGPGYVEDGCGGEAKAVKHNPNGRISPTLDYFDPTAIFGFDTLHLAQGTNPILAPSWSDVMTYCDYQWMSKTTYMKLKEVLQIPILSTALTSPLAPVAQDVLAVFGTLDTLNGEVSMLPISVLSVDAEVTPPTSGPYAIVLRGAGGEELARYPFTPGGMDGGAAPNDAEEDEPATISELIPYMDGITQVEVEGPAGVMYQVEAWLSLPAVQVTAPNGGEVFGEEDITVSWIASDEEGDPLTYNIDYSADNGDSWVPVALFITETQVTVGQLNLPGSDMGLFRVSASDGIHTARDTSDGVFFIPNHLPFGRIVVPAADATIAISQTIAFQGDVYDYELGTLDGDAVQWWSDRDGLLGTGMILSSASLSEGLHEINLVADDGSGQYTLDQVIVTVVSTPDDLPAQPDQLVAAPDLVFLYPASDMDSAVISLDNLNLGNQIEWAVTADAGWVNLSAASGLTPQDITVSTSLTALDFGTHKSLLTFTDPQGLYEPVYIVVVVTIPKYDQFLPMVVRK